MGNKKENKQTIPTFDDLRDNHDAGSCGCGNNVAKSLRSASEKLTADASELPDLTRPTR